MVTLKVTFVFVILIFQVVTAEYTDDDFDEDDYEVVSKESEGKDIPFRSMKKNDEDYDYDSFENPIDYDDDDDGDFSSAESKYGALGKDHSKKDSGSYSYTGRNMQGGSCNRCGIAYGGSDGGRVINGKPVTPVYKYPWIVALVKGNSLTCGGALISANFVLTAGHCVFNKQRLRQPGCRGRRIQRNCYVHPNSLKVALAFREQRRETIAISRIIGHPKYSYTMQIHDVALVQLAKPVRCSAYALPICLPDRNFQRFGQRLIIAGYGQNRPEGTTGRKILREGQVKEVQPRQCHRPNQPAENLRTIVCVTGTESRQSSCFGDSGSALFGKFGRKYYAVGLVSHGTGMGCNSKIPVTFMKTYSALRFIKQYVRDLPEN